MYQGYLLLTHGNIDANGNLDVDGHTDLDDLIVTGVSTFLLILMQMVVLLLTL